jgi:hypothetical protein
MLAKRPEAERRLDAAREQLIAAEAAVGAIAARESSAIDDPAAYKKWQSEHGSAIVELDRIGKLLASREEQAARESKQLAATVLQDRVDKQNRANALLARRLCDEGGKATTVLLALTKEIAQAAGEDAAINAQLPPNAQPVRSAEVLARGRPPLPREEVSEKKAELWVFASTGAVVGAQGDVEVASDGRGTLRSGAQGRPRIYCVKRNFRKIQYREAEPAARVEPLVTALRLPDFAGPGLLWDGPRTHPSKAVIAFDQLSQTNPRPVLTELVPIDDAADADEPADGAR